MNAIVSGRGELAYIDGSEPRAMEDRRPEARRD
jgi:hypothetical protein